MDVLEKITALRKRRNWTTWKLGEESGVDQSTISAWYNKGRSPSVSSLEKVCEACGITMSQFFTNGEPVDLTADQKEVLENWSALSPKQQEIILILIKNMPTQNE